MVKEALPVTLWLLPAIPIPAVSLVTLHVPFALQPALIVLFPPGLFTGPVISFAAFAEKMPQAACLMVPVFTFAVQVTHIVVMLVRNRRSRNYNAENTNQCDK